MESAIPSWKRINSYKSPVFRFHVGPHVSFGGVRNNKKQHIKLHLQQSKSSSDTEISIPMFQKMWNDMCSINTLVSVHQGLLSGETFTSLGMP